MALRTKVSIAAGIEGRIQVMRVDLHREDGYEAHGVGCAILTDGDVPHPIAGLTLAGSRAVADVALFAPWAFEPARLAIATMIRYLPGMVEGAYHCAVWL